jgi:[acyl-carrier-protein] S-malonyltransferase
MNIQAVGFFPGQGSQQVGMGKSFYDEFAVFRHSFEEASDAVGLNIKKLCFDGPESDLTLTENAQPVILAVSTGCYRVCQSTLGIQTQLNLGHSLGEYSALVASGAIPFSQAMKWVRQRGLAMQQAVPIGEGTLSAIIGAENAQVEEWCKSITRQAIENRKTLTPPYAGSEVSCTVEPANYNAPGQVVVSGSVDAVQALEDFVTQQKIRGVMAKRLNVSAPFHSSLMKPARTVMEDLFKSATDAGHLHALKTPYIPNRTARPTQESSIVFELLAEQIDHSVLWSQSVENLLAQGKFKTALEFGPGKVLQGLAKRIAKSVNGALEVLPVFDLESLKAAEEILLKTKPE